MTTFVKLCGSIIRKNKGFTAGIFMMSVLSVAIAFLGANFGACSNETIMQFIEESGAPDVIYVSDLIPEDISLTMQNIPGVAAVSPRRVYDTNLETEDGSLYSVRLFSWDENMPFTHTVHGDRSGEGDAPHALVSVEFAGHNKLYAGEQLCIETPFGKKNVTVEALISNPETMNCVKDEMSAYENYQFAYIYLRNSDFDRIIPLTGQANQWLIYFEEGLSKERQEECMEQLRHALGNNLISESITDESEAMESIRDDLHTISVLCSFIPGVIWLISLGFNFIFIRIIIENQKKMIGILRALGFSIHKVVLIFIVYTVMINLPALLFGVFIGKQMLQLCLGLVAAAEGIIKICIILSPGITSAMLLMIFVIGVAAAIMSVGAIAAIDPCEAYGGMENQTSFEPPKYISEMKTDAFFKISVVSIFRNYKRQIIGALCITACIISMCVGFEGVLTIGHPIDAVYGERFSYDLMVRGIGRNDIEQIKDHVSGIKIAEACTAFSAELLGEDVRVSTLTENDVLTRLMDADGNCILPGDGIVIDEMRAKINGIAVGDSVTLNNHLLPVTGIAREILYPVMYISPKTAENMGYSEQNCMLLRLEENATPQDVERQIAAIRKDAYFVKFDSQKQNMTDGFKAMRTIMFCFSVLAFCIGSLLVLNITIIDFNENKRWYATLLALGTPIRRFRRIALMQNLFRVVLGAVIALPLCYGCVDVLLQLLSGASQQYVMVKYYRCLMISCMIPLLYVLIGTGLSLYKIRKLDFCSLLNKAE